MSKLHFYRVNPDYMEKLRAYDERVPMIADKKALRPFIGVLLTVNDLNYIAPLTSPKPKHKTMKDDEDFIRIAGGEYGAINLNNMIPVTMDYCQKVLFEAIEDTSYRNLLINQIEWCNAKREKIVAKAVKLHEKVTLKSGRPQLIQRCCDFPLLEAVIMAGDQEEQALQISSDLTT